MRQALWVSALGVCAFLGAEEWRKAGRDLDFSLVQPNEPSASRQQAGQTPSASASVPEDDATQRQERAVADLRLRVDQMQNEIEVAGRAIDQARAGGGESAVRRAADESQQRLDDAREALRALQSQKDSIMTDQRPLSGGERLDPAGRERRRVEGELIAEQLRAQLRREELAYQDVLRRYQEVLAGNVDTDLLRWLQSRVQDQGDRLASLRAQYRDIRFGLADQQAMASRMQSEDIADQVELAGLDTRIAQQQALVDELARQRELAASKQEQAGIAAVDAADERYWSLRAELDAASEALETAERTLAELRGSGRQ